MRTEEPQRNWLEVCKRKYAGATVHGSGQYCVRVFDGKNIYLYERFEDAAEHTSRDPKYKFTDLAQEPIKPCRTVGDAYDVDEARAERRAKRAAAAQGTSYSVAE